MESGCVENIDLDGWCELVLIRFLIVETSAKARTISARE